MEERCWGGDGVGEVHQLAGSREDDAEPRFTVRFQERVDVPAWSYLESVLATDVERIEIHNLNRRLMVRHYTRDLVQEMPGTRTQLFCR